MSLVTVLGLAVAALVPLVLIGWDLWTEHTDTGARVSVRLQVAWLNFRRPLPGASRWYNRPVRR